MDRVRTPPCAGSDPRSRADPTETPAPPAGSAVRNGGVAPGDLERRALRAAPAHGAHYRTVRKPRTARTTGSRGQHGHSAPSRRSRRTGRSAHDLPGADADVVVVSDADPLVPITNREGSPLTCKRRDGAGVDPDSRRVADHGSLGDARPVLRIVPESASARGLQRKEHERPLRVDLHVDHDPLLRRVRACRRTGRQNDRRDERDEYGLYRSQGYLRWKPGRQDGSLGRAPAARSQLEIVCSGLRSVVCELARRTRHLFGFAFSASSKPTSGSRARARRSASSGLYSQPCFSAGRGRVRRAPVRRGLGGSSRASVRPRRRRCPR